MAYLSVVRLLLYERTEQKLRTISFRVQDYAAEIRTVHIPYTGCPFNRQLDSLHLPRHLVAAAVLRDAIAGTLYTCHILLWY